MQVTRSGYYQWVEKLEKPDNSLALIKLIVNVFNINKMRYGSRRITSILNTKYKSEIGGRVNRKRITRIMRNATLYAKGKPKFKVTTNSKKNKNICPNLINGDFNSIAPNKLWVSDITYIRTREGWLYLNVIIDCYGRRLVSWRLQDRIDKTIVTKSVLEALENEKPLDLIFHSDRGSQYGSLELIKIFKKYKVQQSMSGKGNCYDNAVAESFFKTLKRELSKRSFKTKKEAELEIFEYLEIYYNNKRIHSANNYKTPKQMFDDYKFSA
jgi:putative transposase